MSVPPKGSAARTPKQAAKAKKAAPERDYKTLLYIPLIGLIPLAIQCLLQTMDNMHHRQRTAPADYPYPSLLDLGTTSIITLGILAARIISVKHLFTPLGRYVLPTCEEKKNWTPASREDRVERFAVVSFKLIYFVCLTIFGYRLLLDTNFLPPELGGSGDIENCWEGFPFAPIIPGLKLYYLVQLSYHLHSLIFHWSTKHRSDFLEMSLHHTCALFLIIFSYYNNYVRVGSIIFLIHDIADVVGYAIKCTVDTKHTNITFAIYLALLSTWGYTRLYVFPFVVIRHVRQSIDAPPAGFLPDEYDARPALWYMLCILQLLHIYWYVLFLIMGYTFLSSGKAVDIQQNPGAEEEARAAKIRQTIKQNKQAQTTAERIGSDREEEDVPEEVPTTPPSPPIDTNVKITNGNHVRSRKTEQNGTSHENNGQAKKRS